MIRQALRRVDIPSRYLPVDESLAEHAHRRNEEGDSIRTAWLLDAWKKARQKAEQSERGFVLALDEIQYVKGWSTIVKGQWDRDRWTGCPLRVIVSGSAPGGRKHDHAGDLSRPALGRGPRYGSSQVLRQAVSGQGLEPEAERPQYGTDDGAAHLLLRGGARGPHVLGPARRERSGGAPRQHRRVRRGTVQLAGGAARGRLRALPRSKPGRHRSEERTTTWPSQRTVGVPEAVPGCPNLRGGRAWCAVGPFSLPTGALLGRQPHALRDRRRGRRRFRPRSVARVRAVNRARSTHQIVSRISRPDAAWAGSRRRPDSGLRAHQVHGGRARARGGAGAGRRIAVALALDWARVHGRDAGTLRGRPDRSPARSTGGRRGVPVVGTRRTSTPGGEGRSAFARRRRPAGGGGRESAALHRYGAAFRVPDPCWHG